MVTEQNEIFCELYLKFGNATKAYRDAGYLADNPAQCGSNLLKKPEIQEYLKRRRAEILNSIELVPTREEIIQELRRCGFQSAKDLVDDEGNFLPISELTLDAAATISGLEFMTVYEDVVENGVKQRKGKMVLKKLRRVSKLDALQTLARMLGHEAPVDPNQRKIPLTIDEIEIVDHNPEKNEKPPYEPKINQDGDAH